MKTLPFAVERAVVIEADPALVFSFFTDPARWAAWWGAGSTLDARTGGAIKIVHSNGFVSTGEVFEFAPPTRFGFTFSMQFKGEIAPEDSRVTFTIEPHAKGTSVRVHHEVADEAVAAVMPQGWRFHLSVFANAVANIANANAGDLAAEWVALWNEPDAGRRAAILERIAHAGLRVRDMHTDLQGFGEVNEQIGAAHKFMGLRYEARSGARHCMGTALADWAGIAKDGKTRMSGTNIFTLRDGRIEAVTSVAAASAGATG